MLHILCFTKKGFTLVELLIVFAVIAILSGILVANFPGIRQELALKIAAHKLAQDIRWVQEMAMAAKKEERCFNPDGTPKSPDYKYGFGVVFSTQDCTGDKPCKDEYILYADRNGNKRYQPSDPDYDILLSSPDFGSTEVQSYSGGATRLNIVFEPPNPTVFFRATSDEELPVQEVFITLQIKNNPAKTKTIIVNKAGLIYVE